MPRNLVAVNLRDSRENCRNNIYAYFIDIERALTGEAKAQHLEQERLKKEGLYADNQSVFLELKKVGLALQDISLRHHKFGSGTTRVRYNYINKANNTYNFVLEYHDIIEIHTNVPIPGYELCELTNATIQPGKLYLKETAKGLQYQVKGPDGYDKYGTIPWAKLPNVPYSAAAIIAAQADYLPLILEQTTKGHTAPYIDFSKIQFSKEPQPELQVSDVDTNMIETGMLKGLFLNTYQNTPLRFELPPAATLSVEERSSGNVVQLMGPQRTEALNLFPAQRTILASLQAQANRIQAARTANDTNRRFFDELNNQVKAQANAPLEVTHLWQTANKLTPELNAELDKQQTALNDAETQLNALKARAEFSLMQNYDIRKGNENHLLRPVLTSAVKALQYTALEYYNSVLVDYKNALKDSKILEFNDKFAGIAEIKRQKISEVIAGNKKTFRIEYVLSFDKSLAAKDITQLGETINNCISGCVKYQGLTGYSTALAMLKANFEAATELKDKYMLQPTSFAWHGTISGLNQEAPFDTSVLNGDIAEFKQQLLAQNTLIDFTKAKIQQLQNTVTTAAEQTAATTMELETQKKTANIASTNTQKSLAKLEQEFNALELVKNNLITIAKTRQSPELEALAQQFKTRDLGDAVRNKFEKLTAYMANLREQVQAIANYTGQIQSSNSLVAAQQLRVQQDEHIKTFVANRDKTIRLFDSIKKTKPILETAEEAALEQAHLKQIEKERVAAAQLEQQRQAKAHAEKRELDKQREATRQTNVIETAKKLVHILSAVNYWHQQVRLWGGVKVPNPDGGATTVPLGISEMIAEKRTLNLAALTYDEAAKFIIRLKLIAERADQRGSWNCCYPVRKTGTTGALYNFVSDFDIQRPALDCDNDFNNIYPAWRQTYSVNANNSPLLSDHQPDSTASHCPGSPPRLMT